MSRKIIKSKYKLYDENVELLAEVPEEKLIPLKPNSELKYIGKGINRIDGYDKVSGTATFTFDKTFPNLVQAKTLRCPHPHASIKRIDTSKAKKLKGVLDILTKDNTEKIKWYRNDTYLFDEHLRYQGDEVACVAAETESLADEALKLIEVEYDILPFVCHPMEAIKENAPKLYDWGNIATWANPSKYDRGSYEDGLNEADIKLEDNYFTQVAVHNPTEVHCSVTNWDGDKLNVWDSTQAIFSVRNSLADALNIPQSKVCVIKKYMGGGFGAKLESGKYTVMAALLAKRLGRPVRIVLDRKEMNLAVGNRPDSFQKVSIGSKKNGTLTALGLEMYGSMGAHQSGAGCAWPMRSLYKCPNIKINEYYVATNAGRARPFRAPGHVQGVFALESMMDEMANKLGMDPIEFRLKNYADSEPNWNIPWTSKLLKECYDKGAKAIGWKEKRNLNPGSTSGTVKRGIGMSSQIWWGGGDPPAYAILKLNSDGSLNVSAGTQDLGTGTYTILAQVAAEVLEIPLTKISVNIGNTDEHPFAPSSGGSTTTPSMTPAVYDAALQIRKKLLSAASAILELLEKDLVYSEGTISDGTNTKKITIQEVIDKMNVREIVAAGARNENPKGYMINSFGAQFAEVEVDTETGRVTVLKIVAAHDIGRVINRKLLENQFHGGIMQGLSYALLEERIMDEYTGKVLTTNLHSYKIPTVMDYPEIEVITVGESDNMISTVGAKGIGEPAIIPTAGAIANAIFNATGLRMKSLPITPDKILNEIYKL